MLIDYSIFISLFTLSIYCINHPVSSKSLHCHSNNIEVTHLVPSRKTIIITTSYKQIGASLFLIFLSLSSYPASYLLTLLLIFLSCFLSAPSSSYGPYFILSSVTHSIFILLISYLSYHQVIKTFFSYLLSSTSWILINNPINHKQLR